MNIEGNVVELREGKTVEIKPGDAYQDIGEDLELLARSEPPFYEEQAEEVESLFPLSFADEITQASQFGEVVL